MAKEICDILDIRNSRQAVAKLDADEKDVIKADTLGGKQIKTIINEPGLYSLIFRRNPRFRWNLSKKLIAKANSLTSKIFKRWVTHEVLPSIRQTGG